MLLFPEIKSNYLTIMAKSLFRNIKIFFGHEIIKNLALLHNTISKKISMVKWHLNSSRTEQENKRRLSGLHVGKGKMGKQIAASS